MKAPLTLRRPANWQDFESLCKVLWGEIWNCPEIQKNGRLGQDQSGVDIFGIPAGEDAYYGIQCKGRSEYNDAHPQFTTKEIEEEIARAKAFEPALRKLYLATTALSDAKIQAFVRQINLVHIKSGLFEVHLFSWEAIAELVDQNRRTSDYYVKSLNYKTQYSVRITFENGETEINCNPLFKRECILYKMDSPIESGLVGYLKAVDSFHKLYLPQSRAKKINKSYFKILLSIQNDGIEPLENYKVFLTFEGDVIDLKDDNEVSEGFRIFSNYLSNVEINSKSKTVTVLPHKPILVGDDKVLSDEIYVKTSYQKSIIKIKWKLVSKNFKDEGDLIINVIPKILRSSEVIIVDNPADCRLVDGDIVDDISEDNS